MRLENALKTGRALQWALDNPEKVEGMQEYIDSSKACLEFDLDYGSDPKWDEAMDGALFPIPDWIENIDYAINGRYEYDLESLMCQFVTGYYEPYRYGETIEIDGNQYLYIASIVLSEESEFQAGSGGLAYYYWGPNFLRILEPIELAKGKEYPK